MKERLCRKVARSGRADHRAHPQWIPGTMVGMRHFIVLFGWFALASMSWACSVLADPSTNASPDFTRLAHGSGTPHIPGLKIVWLSPWGDPARANAWRNIIVHQTEGPAGSARNGALEQFKTPTRRGVTIWLETDGTVYWAVREDLIPTHGDGANRNDNKFIDNAPTFHQVVKTNSIGVEFAGNFPDVAAPPTSEQLAAWDILVRVLQARYSIPAGRIYAHNWIDFKDSRYCEGCELARRARELNFAP
jgi:hypothetical protein